MRASALLALAALLAFVYWDAITKNQASLATNSSDPGLQALELPCSTLEAVQRVTSLAASLPRWMIVTVNGKEGSIQAVHTTRFWHQLNEDIQLKFEPAGEDRCLLTGDSRSRSSMVDFGQNARNLKELRQAILASLTPPANP